MPGRVSADDASGATRNLAAALAGADVAIDFTLPAALPGVLDACVASQTALVSGVTGLTDADHAALSAAAATIPLLHEHNLSVGVHVLTALLAHASEWLPPEFSCELVETHHSGKRDAPSGTALSLVDAVGDRPVTTHSLRGGGVIGEHTVHYLGPMERLSLTHRADDRRVFAAGALNAARWLVRQRPGGVFRIADCIGTGR